MLGGFGRTTKSTEDVISTQYTSFLGQSVGVSRDQPGPSILGRSDISTVSTLNPYDDHHISSSNPS